MHSLRSSIEFPKCVNRVREMLGFRSSDIVTLLYTLYTTLTLFTAAPQDVKMVAWHPAGELLASCSYDDTVKLWTNDGDEWVCSQTLTGHASTVRMLRQCSALIT